MKPRAADDFSAIKRCLDGIRGQKSAGLAMSAVALGGGAGSNGSNVGVSSAERGRRWPKADLVLGKTRNGKLFVLTEKGRRLHIHMPGLSGMGKSSLIESMIRQDINNGQGLMLIDPDGSLYNRLVAWLASLGMNRRRKIRLVNVAELNHRFGFNPLRVPGGYEIAGVVDTVMDAIATAWDDNLDETPRLQKCLRAMLFLLAQNGYTLCEFPYLLGGPDCENVREFLLSRITNPMFRFVWNDFAAMGSREFREQFESSINRISAFLDTPVVKSIIGQRIDVVDLQRSMDEGEIILVNLEPNQQLGFSALDARLLGNLIISGVVSAAMARPADVSRPFWLYVDEAYAFINSDIEMALDRCRKRGLHLALAHQRLGQLYDRSQTIGDSVVEGTQCKIIFRLVGESAETMANQVFGNTFNLEEPKKSLIKPVVVGYEKVLLKGRSHGLGTNSAHTAGHGESQDVTISDSIAQGKIHVETETEAEGETFGEGDTYALSQSQGRTKGSARGTNSSHTDALSEPETGGYFELRPDPDARITTSDTSGVSAMSSEGENSAFASMQGHSSMRANTTTRGRAISDGTTEMKGHTEAIGKGTQTNQSDTVGTSSSEGESEQEAFVPILEDRSGGTYSLEELKHRYAMRLANIEERHAIVKVQNHAPVEITVNDVKPARALPHHVTAFAGLLTQSDEYTKPSALIDQELAERPMKLIREAAEWRLDQEQVRRQVETDDDNYNE